MAESKERNTRMAASEERWATTQKYEGRCWVLAKEWREGEGGRGRGWNVYLEAFFLTSK
jgi:hypothetical protein